MVRFCSLDFVVYSFRFPYYLTLQNHVYYTILWFILFKAYYEVGQSSYQSLSVVVSYV